MSLREIAQDWPVFSAEGTVAIGAVRAVHSGHLVVYIEGFGEVDIHAGEIAGAHDGKVILKLDELPGDVQQAIAHAHDRETR